MNVLSIDWDYFIDCTQDEICFLFPDGGNENIGIQLSNQIWAMHYAKSSYSNFSRVNRELKDIGINKESLNFVLLTILNNSKSHTCIQLSESHTTIYDLILETYTRTGEKVDIYNIDHHSDTYNLGSELNCGNWVNYLDTLNCINNYTWIQNVNTKETLNQRDFEHCNVNTTTDLTILDNIPHWDIIFICKSSIWTPPHLDNEFRIFYDTLKTMGYDFSDSLFNDRYAEIQEEIENYKSHQYRFTT